MLRYHHFDTGPATDDSLTRAVMLADATSGPLKEKLQISGGASPWGGLNSDPSVSVNIAGYGGSPETLGYTFRLDGGGVDVLRLVSANTGVAAAIVEIRFNPSAIR